MNKRVTIIDYGVGNLLSLKMSLEHLGADVIITRDKNLILNSSHIILPGVGAFSKAMNLIKKYKINEYLFESKKKGSYILGICLGMQLLMTSSEEFGFTKGLNFIEGEVKSITKQKNYNEDVKIPNIGWFNLIKKNKSSKETIMTNISENDSFYFVHSYVCNARDEECLKFYSEYSNIEVTAIIKKKNIIGCQFHPEKSGKAGLKLLGNFLSLKIRI